jgi:hypothetical protein
MEKDKESTAKEKKTKDDAAAKKFALEDDEDRDVDFDDRKKYETVPDEEEDVDKLAAKKIIKSAKKAPAKKPGIRRAED